MEFTEEDVCKLFDDEETNNTSATIPSNNDDITILFSVNDKTTNNSSLAKIQCLPNGFNVNGKRSPSNTTHNVFVSDQLRVQLFKPLDIEGSLVCQLFINETLHTEKTFNELHECSLTIPRCNKGGSNGKSRIGYLKLVQKQDEQKLVGLSNNFWIRTKTRKETVTNDKKTTEDKKLKKREYEEDSESSYSSDSKRKKQPTSDTINNEQTHSLFEENQGLKKRIAELEKLVSDILTGKLDQIPMTAQNPAIGQSTLKNTKPRPSPLSVPTLLTSNTFGMCSPTNLMTSSCSSPGLEMSPTFFMTSPPRTGFEDYPSNYSFDDMSDFF